MFESRVFLAIINAQFNGHTVFYQIIDIPKVTNKASLEILLKNINQDQTFNLFNTFV